LFHINKIKKLFAEEGEPRWFAFFVFSRKSTTKARMANAHIAYSAKAEQASRQKNFTFLRIFKIFS